MIYALTTTTVSKKRKEYAHIKILFHSKVICEILTLIVITPNIFRTFGCF
jgi:hypothetical protein